MMSPAPCEFTFLDQAFRLLAKANTLKEIKALRDRAVMARTYLKATRHDLQLQNRATEVKLRAERKAGTILRSLKLRGGDRRSKRQKAALKLADLGISQDESRRWQRLASIPEKDFRRYLKRCQQKVEVTSAGLSRFARNLREKRRAGKAGQAAHAALQYGSDAPQDLIVELQNHCHFLDDVLRPVSEDGRLDVMSSERRVMGRKIQEMKALIARLRRMRQ